MIRLNWADAEDEFAVCLCRVGQTLRRSSNEGHLVAPLWHVWCAREQVDASRVVPLEDVLTVEELEARGLRVQPGQIPSREASLLAAGRAQKKR